MVELKPEDQHLLRDKKTMYFNLQMAGCILPSYYFVSAAFLVNVTKGRKLLPHKDGIEGLWIKYYRHKESMKFKESVIQVWIN